MIRPAISPRRITTSASVGLISAARSGVRNVQSSVNTISNAPGVTREQKFGMNYVGFFGSKKNSKILNKSLKIIRDSIVSTFGIASALKLAVKTGSGVFGFVGKIIGLAGSILPFLTIFAPLLKLIAIGGLGGLLFTFKDQIFNFFKNSATNIFNIIKNNATGFKDFIRDSVKEFFIDANKSGQFGIIRDRSRERLNQDLSEVKNLQDIEKANQIEIKKLEEEKRIYKELNPDKEKTEEYRQQVKAYDDRITEIKTGRIPIDLNRGQRFFKNRFNIGPALGVGQKLFRRVTTDRGQYPENYDTLTQSEKKDRILQTFGSQSPTFDEQGNLNENIVRLSQTYNRDLKRGNLSDDQETFANDFLQFLKELTTQSTQTMEGDQSSSVDFSKFLKPTITPNQKSYQINRDNRKDNRGGSTFRNKGDNVSILPMGGNKPSSDIISNDIGSGNASPSMQIFSNVDHDNFVALINKSSLNVL